MNEKAGWIAAVVVLGVLLVGGLVVLGVLLATQDDNGASRDDDARVAELEEKITQLQGDVAQANADAASARQAASTQAAAGGSSGSSGLNGGSGPSGSSGTSDKAQIEALALAFAQGVDPTVDWDTGNTFINGNWASVGVGSPTDHSVQGCILYYHKVSGSWTMVTYGTGLCPGDIPGAPDSIYQ